MNTALLLVAVFGQVSPVAWSPKAAFYSVGFNPGDTHLSYANAASASRPLRVAVTSHSGFGSNAISTASVWAIQEGLFELQHNFGLSYAQSISADGTRVVGTGSLPWNGSGYDAVAMAWDPANNMMVLGDLPGSTMDAGANGVSADGEVIVGVGSSLSGQQAFRWTKSDGIVGLGYLPGVAPGPNSEATDVSTDGSAIVGHSRNQSNVQEAFVWTQSQGMQGLGILPSGTDSYAKAVSGDGTTIVGWTQFPTMRGAFRWDAANGMQAIGPTPSAKTFVYATDVSSDGATVLGYQHGPSSTTASCFLWNAASGTRDLAAVFHQDYGLILPVGWRLNDHPRFSADDHVIVGVGRNTLNQPEGWVAVFYQPDLDVSGEVDAVDLLQVIQDWGASGHLEADINRDGLVNVSDLLLIILNWGPLQI